MLSVKGWNDNHTHIFFRKCMYHAVFINLVGWGSKLAFLLCYATLLGLWNRYS